MKIYIRNGYAFLREMPFATETLEVEELERKPEAKSTETHSIRLKYINGELVWAEELDRGKVRGCIDGLKGEMNANSYNTEKFVQGVLSDIEYNAHKLWCAEMRKKIQDFEELLKP